MSMILGNSAPCRWSLAETRRVYLLVGVASVKPCSMNSLKSTRKCRNSSRDWHSSRRPSSPGFTTAEGCNALNSLTTGAGNTGLGWYSLFFDTDGSYNTGVGAGALVLNNAASNTAVGAAALLLNTTGTLNTATGTDALVYNDSGNNNT